MPILYINNKQNHNMKTLNEMTQIEAMDWIRVQNISVLNGYTKQEAQTMTDLVRSFIDPKQKTCANCGTTGNLRDAKNKFTKYYLQNKDMINSIAYQYHTNIPGVKPLDQMETIYNEINDAEDIQKIEEIVFGEFKDVTPSLPEEPVKKKSKRTKK